MYRRRLIPDEKVHLKDDEIVKVDENVILTKWNVLRPRNDFSHGVSCVFIKENVKVSKMFDANNQLVYYYCDIVNVEYDEVEHAYTVNDLLVDVIVMPDGFVKVLDLDEIPKALEKHLITNEDVMNILLYLDKLLKKIYNGDFHTLTDCLA